MPYHSKLESKDMDALCDAILSLKTREECYRFFEDLCTIHELQSMEQRFLVARMLHAKDVYQNIAASTGASTATISRVNRCLQYGAGGYQLVLKSLDPLEKGDK